MATKDSPMTTFVLVEEYAFLAAHLLPDFPEGDPDRGMHGHVWTAEIHVGVSVGEKGYAFDHARIDDAVDVVLRRVDHKVINTVPGLEIGTNEVLAKWLGIEFMVALLMLDVPATPTLQRLVLGQFSHRKFRLVRHKLVWEPTDLDREMSVRKLKDLKGQNY